MIFKQNDKTIFMYYIISPYVLVIDAYILIFNLNHSTIIFVLTLTILSILTNLYDILKTYNTVSLTDKSLSVEYLFFHKRSQTIKIRDIVNVYFHNQRLAGFIPFNNIELRHKTKTGTKSSYLYKGHMSTQDFDYLKNTLLKINTKRGA